MMIFSKDWMRANEPAAEAAGFFCAFLRGAGKVTPCRGAAYTVIQAVKRLN